MSFMDKPPATTHANRIQASVQMLRTYLDIPELAPLTAALEALQHAPENPDCLARVKAAFGELTILQGAALTYAPYLLEILSDGAFDPS
jgi:hypothetical protein